MKSVPQSLSDLGAIYKERNATYGDTYKMWGGILMSLFPNGIHAVTVEECNKIALFIHMADKMVRYAQSMKRGGHIDSLDDLTVYAQMLQEYDALCRSST